MSVIEIYTSADDSMNEIRRRLGNMQKKAPLALRSALNKTAKEAKKQDERLTKRTYTAKSDIHSLQFEKATTGNLTAILRDKGANISIAHFTHYAGKRGVSAIINTTHGRKKISKYGNPAWFNVLEKGGNGIAVRIPGVQAQKGRRKTMKLSKHSEAVEKLYSISSPVMHGNDQTWGTIEDATHQKLHENTAKEIERILGT